MLTQCNCSICRRYGALWAYYQRRSVRITCAEGGLHSYAFRNATRRFSRCRACGCVTHYERTRQKADGTDTLAVNVRNVDDPRIVAAVPVKLLDGASSWRVLEERAQPGLLGSPLS